MDGKLIDHLAITSDFNLYVRHIVMNAARQVTGVIDWGDVELGEAARDLAVAFTMFPPRAREALLVAYGATTADAALAQVIAVHHALAGLAYAHAAGDEDLRRELLSAISWMTST